MKKVGKMDHIEHGKIMNGMDKFQAVQVILNIIKLFGLDHVEQAEQNYQVEVIVFGTNLQSSLIKVVGRMGTFGTHMQIPQVTAYMLSKN